MNFKESICSMTTSIANYGICKDYLVSLLISPLQPHSVLAGLDSVSAIISRSFFIYLVVD
jgi:hypothetical protein